MDNNNSVQIDALLERYLGLLDEYTALRADLARLQAQCFQHLARANFAAERGARYGADCYDERMQASRRVVVDVGDGSVSSAAGGNDDEKNHQQHDDVVSSLLSSSPTFRVVTFPGDDGDDDNDRGDKEGEAEEEDPVAAAAAAKESVPKDDDDDVAETTTTNPPPSSSSKDHHPRSKQQTIQKNDPLRWFGLLTPAALRQTQACAVHVVADIVPRLVSVDAAMRDVEIAVRRARKRRAKAEAAAAAAAATGAKVVHEEHDKNNKT